MEQNKAEVWASGVAYEPYVGRWSRLVAQEFVKWLKVPPGSSWLDVGCGTGALTQTILNQSDPKQVLGIDRSPEYVAYAQERIVDPRASFKVGDSQALPLEGDSFEVIVSGLVLNFIPQPAKALAEMSRVVRPGGIIAAYVWDYRDRMQLMRYFWDAAVELNPSALLLDEGQRFPLCQPKPLEKLFQEGGLSEVLVSSFEVPTFFRDFEDYWSPFLGGQGPAAGYCMSLDEDHRNLLRETIRSKLPIASDGSISLVAKAWAVRGTKI